MKAPHSSTKKALITEDEPAVGNICARVLTNIGFEVDIAVNGKLAQDMLAEKQYDLCLIDIRLPKMSGKELYWWLQEKHPQQAKRVIFTSGDVIGGDTLAFLEQAVRPFLPKPFAPDELRAIVKEALKEVEH